MDIAGPRKAETRRGIHWAWSITAKTAFLGVVFVLVPVFLYIEFRSAHETSQELLLRSVRAEGRTISQSLLPLLTNADGAALPEIGRDLARYAGEVTTIKLLLQPAGTQNRAEGFYYVASWPPVASSNLEAERDTLANQGVLDRLAENCREEMPFSLIYHRPTGGAEIVTAVTPVSTAAGCWAVVASFSEDAFPGAHLGRPYWATPPVIIAAVIYVTMAAITFATLLSVRGGLRRFALRARHIREQGPDAGSFADRDNLPELADVAAEFDRMVDALHRSAADIRQTAEDNAHAFKTPIAVIRQSIEPLFSQFLRPFRDIGNIQEICRRFQLSLQILQVLMALGGRRRRARVRGPTRGIGRTAPRSAAAAEWLWRRTLRPIVGSQESTRIAVRPSRALRLESRRFPTVRRT